MWEVRTPRKPNFKLDPLPFPFSLSLVSILKREPPCILPGELFLQKQHCEEESRPCSIPGRKTHRDCCSFAVPQWGSTDAFFHMWSNSPRRSIEKRCRCSEVWKLCHGQCTGPTPPTGVNRCHHSFYWGSSLSPGWLAVAVDTVGLVIDDTERYATFESIHLHFPF